MPPDAEVPGEAAPQRSPDRLPDRLPAQATMGLLEYVTAHALDEDYAYAAERREPAPAPGRRAAVGPRRRGVGVLGAAALAVFMLLLVVAAAQTSQGAAADTTQRRDLAAQVVAQRDRLAAERARLRLLETDTQQLQEAQLASDASAGGLRERVERLGLLTGALAVVGPGVEVVVDDAPGSDSDRTRVLDTDLQRLVNGWWAAGAEAISVNGQRLTTLSTIRVAGDAITVNNRGLRAPYRLLVVGDPDTLPARFAETASGQAWLDLQRQVGLQLTITPADTLRLPGAAPSLRYAAPARDADQRAGDRPEERQEGGTP